VKWLKRKWKQFWCLHTWQIYYDPLTDLQLAEYYVKRLTRYGLEIYECKKCGKILITNKIPISYIEEKR